MLDLFRPLTSRDHPLQQARQALEQLRGAAVLPTLEQLCSTLNHCGGQLTAPADKVRLLLLLDEPAHQAVLSLKQTLAETEAGSARLGLLLRHGLQLVNAFRYQASEAIKHKGVSGELVAIFLRWTASAFLLQRLGKDSADALNWRRIIGPFCVKSETGDDFRIELTRVDADIGQQLGRLALLSMVLPLPLDLRQVLIAERLIGYLAGQVLLSPVYLPTAPFVLTLASQGRPDRLEGWERAGDDMRALFLGFEELDEITGHWRQELGNAVPLEQLVRPLPGQTASETLALIDIMRNSWVSRARSRAEPREAIDGQIWACCDTLRIRGLLAQPVKRRPAQDALVVEASLFNISRRGVGMLFDQEYRHARTGALIALYQERRSCWALGIIRRTAAELDGRRFVGVELLSDSVSSASIVGDAQERQMALLLPPCGERTAGALLLPEPALTAGRRYTLVSDKQEKPIVVESFLLAGNDFVLYLFQPAPD